MKFLFIHQNFPGQYVHVARHLAQAGHEVSFHHPAARGRDRRRPQARIPAGAVGPEAHPYLRELESGVANGLAVARLCEWLDRDGFVPDIVIGHNGWGEILYVKDVWPQTPLLGYFEFFYRASGSDVDFDPRIPAGTGRGRCGCARATRSTFLGLDAVDWGQSPTEWQRSQYPKRHRDRITHRARGGRYDLVQARSDGAAVARQRPLPVATPTRS